MPTNSVDLANLIWTMPLCLRVTRSLDQGEKAMSRSRRRMAQRTRRSRAVGELLAKATPLLESVAVVTRNKARRIRIRRVAVLGGFVGAVTILLGAAEFFHIGIAMAVELALVHIAEYCIAAE